MTHLSATRDQIFCVTGWHLLTPSPPSSPSLPSLCHHHVSVALNLAHNLPFQCHLSIGMQKQLGLLQFLRSWMCEIIVSMTQIILTLIPSVVLGVLKISIQCLICMPTTFTDVVLCTPANRVILFHYHYEFLQQWTWDRFLLLGKTIHVNQLNCIEDWSLQEGIANRNALFKLTLTKETSKLNRNACMYGRHLRSTTFIKTRVPISQNFFESRSPVHKDILKGHGDCIWIWTSPILTTQSSGCQLRDFKWTLSTCLVMLYTNQIPMVLVNNQHWLVRTIGILVVITFLTIVGWYIPVGITVQAIFA